MSGSLSIKPPESPGVGLDSGSVEPANALLDSRVAEVVEALKKSAPQEIALKLGLNNGSVANVSKSTVEILGGNHAYTLKPDHNIEAQPGKLSLQYIVPQAGTKVVAPEWNGVANGKLGFPIFSDSVARITDLGTPGKTIRLEGVGRPVADAYQSTGIPRGN